VSMRGILPAHSYCRTRRHRMFGLIVLVAWLLVWAFLLSWISNIVLKDEISIGNAAAIIVVTGIVGTAYRLLIAGDSALLGLLKIPLDIVVMAGLLSAVAHAPFKKGVIIASIYAATSYLFWLVVGMLLASA
jgi:hypothetical protein